MGKLYIKGMEDRMKKRIIKKMLFVAIFLFCIMTFPVHADSGWGGNHDSGGSSSWSSSSSSRNRSYSEDGEVSLAEILFYFSFCFGGLYFYYLLQKK